MSDKSPPDRPDEPGSTPCEDESVDLYLDGEFPLEREAQLFRHLASCSACRTHLNGVLAFRRVSREEYIEIPPWADDELLVRIDARRRARERTSQLHTSQSLWSASTTVTVRSLVLVVAAVVLSAVLFVERIPSTGRIIVEQERVQFGNADTAPGSEIYVIYPGLTIEAERESDRP